MRPAAGVLVALSTGSALLLLSVAARPVLAVESGCPGSGSPSPAVLLCEDFEDSGVVARWNIGSHFDLYPAALFALCTGDSFGFGDRCAAWSNLLVFDNAWGFWGYDARRSFSPEPEFYIRWYQYISDPYAWGSLEDKSVMLHDAANTLVAYVGTNRNQLPSEPNSGPGRPFVANYQDVDVGETGGQYTKVNRFQNQGNIVTLQPGKWYLFEWHVKLNTPGVSDGVTRLWINDASAPVEAQVLRMQYGDMRWLKSGDTGKRFSVLRLTVYNQRCDFPVNLCPPLGPVTLIQSHRWDQIVVARSRIGPIGGMSAPPAPAGLQISR